MNKADASDTAACLQRGNDAPSPPPLFWRVIHMDGEEHILKVVVHPIIDKKTDRNGFWGMARDVTGKMNAQSTIVKSQRKIEALYATSKKAERRYHGFLKFLPLPLMVRKLDNRVIYINPAFETTFGWNLNDFNEDPLVHIPPDQFQTTKTGKKRLLQDGALFGLETKRLTKDGRLLDVINDSSVFYDKDNKAEGSVIILRDITKNKKDAKISESFFSIAKALHHYSDLDSRLSFIARQVRSLLQVQHVHIILVDEEKKEFYFRAGVDVNPELYKKFYRKRIPLTEKYFSGKVLLSGTSRIINDLDKENVQLILGREEINNLLGVPMKVGTHIIGAMTVSNKVDGSFTETDTTLLESICNIVSLPIENAKINEELRNSLSEIKSLNRAKDRIIEHLSHELRTPLSVLSASLQMLTANDCLEPVTAARILERSQRNLKRITDMQAKIADITRNQHLQVKQSLLSLLELCTDEVESVTDEALSPEDGAIVRRRITEIFSPQTGGSQRIPLNTFIHAKCEAIRADFSHRQVLFSLKMADAEVFIDLPVEILDKILAGLIRNAIEYTPDGGKVELRIRELEAGKEITVTDTGIGITPENQQLIFGNYFTNADITRYGTGHPFDFNAGGSGFDLLRMRVFSERYNFKLIMQSQRCRHIPDIHDVCPGNTTMCMYCNSPEYCHTSGGTIFTVRFRD